MVIETIIWAATGAFAVVVVAAGSVLAISTYKSIALGLAEISEAGKNTRERVNVRADLAYDDSDSYSEADQTSEGSELDGLARMLGYSDVGSALSDPALLAKLTGKTNEE